MTREFPRHISFHRPAEGHLIHTAIAPANAVMRVVIEHDGMTDGLQLALIGRNKSGQERVKRWIRNDVKRYPVVFHSADVDEKIEYRLYAQALEPGQRIDITVSGFEVGKLQDRAPPSDWPKFTDTSVTVSMATYPMREKMLPDSVNSLVDQCDQLMIYLNNYRVPPAFLVNHPKADKIAYILDTASTRRAAAKFHWSHLPGYHLNVDDDIIYPPDYAKKMIAAVEKYGRKAIIGVHGLILTERISDTVPMRKGGARFQEALEADAAMHIIGTGTTAFHSDTVAGWDWSFAAQYAISSDESFSSLAMKTGTPLVAIAREEMWLKSHPEMKYGIFEEKQLVPASRRPAIELLRAHEPFLEPKLPPTRGAKS